MTNYYSIPRQELKDGDLSKLRGHSWTLFIDRSILSNRAAIVIRCPSGHAFVPKGLPIEPEQITCMNDSCHYSILANLDNLDLLDIQHLRLLPGPNELEGY